MHQSTKLGNLSPSINGYHVSPIIGLILVQSNQRGMIVQGKYNIYYNTNLGKIVPNTVYTSIKGHNSTQYKIM